MRARARRGGPLPLVSIHHGLLRKHRSRLGSRPRGACVPHAPAAGSAGAFPTGCEGTRGAAREFRAAGRFKFGDIVGRISYSIGREYAAARKPDSAGCARRQPSAVARVTRAVRMIEESRESELTVGRLAHEARLSPYHFLRIFVQLTCVTPHQYVRRARLRDAAMRLGAERVKVSDIALDCGFGDVSNFNRAFRREFGLSPQEFRAQRSKYAIF